MFDLDRIVVDERLLSPAERERVDRKATVTLRQRQAASFQCVRVTLGAALGVPPDDLAIEIDENGKPRLGPSANQSARCHFNVSHSAGVGALAWSGSELGIDVEALIARPTTALAEEILTPSEFEDWQRLQDAARQPWLTRAWVRKESALKARGSGLRIPPRAVEVGGGSAEGAPWSARIEGRLWRGVDVFDAVPEGFRAAVCLEPDDAGSI